MSSKAQETTSGLVAVVNDDPSQVRLLSNLLAGAGFQVIQFTDAGVALETIYREGAPDLIITDLNMPGIDGWRFCRLLRSSEYRSLNKTPLLVISATFTGDEPKRIATDLGADAFLPMPLDGRKFLDTVHSLVAGEWVSESLRVLIVEDSPTQTSIIKKMFEVNNYRTDTALSASEAKDCFSRNRYDLAILDYHLPDAPGDTLLHSFREQRPDCVYLMMTTDPSPELALAWMRMGAAAYVRKPFDPAYLIELCARARRERSLFRVQDLLELRTRELLERELQFRSLVEGAPDAIFVQTGGQFSYVNPAALRLFGTEDAKDILGSSVVDRFHPDYHEQVKNRISQLNDEKRAVPRAEEVILRLDGTTAPTEVSAVPIQFNNQCGALVFLHDITERKKTEEARRESESRYRAISEYSHNAICIVDEQAKILWANDKMLEMAGGYTREQLYSAESFVGFLAPESTEFVIANFGKFLAGEPYEHHYKFYFVRSDGEKRLCEKYMIHVTDQDGKRSLIISMLDITERKRAEEDRERLQAQLLQSQKMESVGRLAGGVAHDFNNMLAVILGHVGLALADVDQDDPVHENLLEIEKAAERSADLTRQLLAFARKQTVAPKVLDLNETVSGMTKMLRRLIGENIKLDWKPGENLQLVKIDPAQIDQILANLCVNASDAIDGVGVVTISTENAHLDDEYCATHPDIVPGDYVLLSVSDNGRGMDHDTIAHAFEPFFTTKGVGEGTGLGLATVYGVVKQNKGSIQVQSEPGKGTKLSILLPGHAHGANGTAQRVAVPLDAEHGGYETILLVEDEPSVLSLGKTLLERLGYRVLPANTPDGALQLARDHSGEIHLLMTDVVMPDMNGRDLAKKLLSQYPDMKRLFVSGYTANVIASHGILEDGVNFIQKPFNRHVLAVKLREILDAE